MVSCMCLVQLHDLKQHANSSVFPATQPHTSATSANYSTEHATPLYSNPTSFSATLPSSSTTTTSWAFPFLSQDDSQTVTPPTTRENLCEPLLQQNTGQIITSSSEPAQLPHVDMATEKSRGSSHAEDDAESSVSVSTADYQPFGDASGDHTVVELHRNGH